MVGILGKMFRVFNVAGLSREARAGDRRPLQLQINEAKRQLEVAQQSGHPDPGSILVHIDQMTGLLLDRNQQAQDLEKRGQMDAAVALYESNIDDMFDGSLPYERLIDFYTQQGAKEDAERVARACLVHCTSGVSEKLRARCLSTLELVPGLEDPTHDGQ
ncbi:MAG: hypothetical protein KGN37_14540 [Burkholderiales bacterium]|nr:hypothetical protein [Burkholderiales bacterium]